MFDFLFIYVGEDELVFFLDIFGDAFSGYTFRQRSTFGLYMSVLNIRKKHQSRKYIYPLMLLPPGIDLHEALARFRADMAQLEAGVVMQVYPESGDQPVAVPVKAVIGILSGDHVQACANACHGGIACNMNCRMCFSTKEDRIEFDDSILEWKKTRREAQFEALKAQILLQAGNGATPARINRIRSLYGVTMDELPYGEFVDPFTQAFACVGHMIDLGLLSRLLAFMLKWIPPRMWPTFVARLESLEYPRGWVRLPPFRSKLTGRLSQPMKIVLKLSLFAPILLPGLVPDDVLDLTLSLVRLRAMLMRNDHTDQSIAAVSLMCKQHIYF